MQAAGDRGHLARAATHAGACAEIHGRSVAVARDRRRRLRQGAQVRGGDNARRSRRDGSFLQLMMAMSAGSLTPPTPPTTASAWIEQWSHLVEKGGAVLDVAAGK